MKKNSKGFYRNEEAQLGIDFIVGLSIFLLALSFVAVSVSGMFLPFQTEVIDTNSVSYRTSVILVEDPGYWDNGINDGKDWENHIDDIGRIGLAVDKENPNVLGIDKLSAFKDEAQIDNEMLSDKLGLYRIIGDTKVYYGYNIALTSLEGEVLALRGSDIPEYGDVSSMERIVDAQIDSIYDISGLKSMFPHQDDKADFSVTTPESELRLIIRDIVVQNPPNNPQLNYVKIDGGQIDLGEDYWIWIDNGTGVFELQEITPVVLPEEPHNIFSRLRIVIDKNVFIDEEAFFGDEKHLIEIKFVGVIAEVGITDLDEIGETVISESAILKVNVWS